MCRGRAGDARAARAHLVDGARRDSAAVVFHRLEVGAGVGGGFADAGTIAAVHVVCGAVPIEGAAAVVHLGADALVAGGDAHVGGRRRRWGCG